MTQATTEYPPSLCPASVNAAVRGTPARATPDDARGGGLIRREGHRGDALFWRNEIHDAKHAERMRGRSEGAMNAAADF